MIGTAKDGGLISRAVREALGTLVSPPICEQLIKRSLMAYGLTAIPETGVQIGEWLEAGLRPEVETTVGTDAADLVMMQLGPIAAYAAIAVPKAAPRPAARVPARVPSSLAPPAFPSEEPDRPTNLRVNPDEMDWTPMTFPEPAPGPATLPHGWRARDATPVTGRLDAFDSSPDMAMATAPPSRAISDSGSPDNDVALYTARPQASEAGHFVSKAPVTLPAVLVASTDMGGLEALRRYLSGTAEVAHIPDLVGLLDALDAPGMVEPVVLIDCKRPTVHAKSVAALGEDLPRGTTVVLWGADDATWEQIDRERSPACRWVRCSREASSSDVGSLCAMLIG